MFPRLPVCATFVADTKNVSDFVQKHFVSTTNVSQKPKKHHGQQCARDNVSSFTRALRLDLSQINLNPVENAFATQQLTFLATSVAFYPPLYPGSSFPLTSGRQAMRSKERRLEVQDCVLYFDSEALLSVIVCGYLFLPESGQQSN